MEVVKQQSISWEDFCEEQINEEGPYMYRGQSNGTNGVWKLISSYDRSFCGKKEFDWFVMQQSFSSNIYDAYQLDTKYKINSKSILDRLSLFQHYGVPTCLLDFTYNPLIALYFGIASIVSPNTKSFVNGEYKEFPEGSHFSIYRLNYKVLLEHFGIKELTKESDLDINEYQTCQLLEPRMSNNPYVALILKPNENNNANIRRQQGCFLLYQEGGCEQGFESFISEYAKNNEIKVTEPVLKIFNIKYNSIFKLRNSSSDPTIITKGECNLSDYLKEKEIFGGRLFDDLQGIKYDMGIY